MKRILVILNHCMMSIVILLIFVKCSEEKISTADENTIPVTLIEIENSLITIPILTSGKISAQKEMKLSFKTGGILKEIYVDEGDNVKKGEVLAKINLEEINAKVIQAKSAYQKTKRDFERVKLLFKDSVVTLEGLQNAETAYDVAKANLDIAKFNQNYSTIVAPSDGQIYKKFAEVNEIIAPGSPIFRFGSSSNKWKIVAGITDRDIKRLKIGDSAKVFVDAQPQKFFKATISEIAGTIDPMSFTYEVELLMNTKMKNLISGMIASVKIFPEAKGKFKAVPLKSLVNANELTGEVFVVNKNDIAENRLIYINDIWNEMVIIESGLENDNRVILDGVEYVYNGAKVNVKSVKSFRFGDYE